MSIVARLFKRGNPAAKSAFAGESLHATRSLLVRDPFAGAWQKNKELTVGSAVSHGMVFACVTRIAEDMAKMPLHLTIRTKDDINERADSYASKLIANPNSYQNRQQFIYAWEVNIQTSGNAYIYKEYTGTKVTALHVLNSTDVEVRVSPRGMVFYELQQNKLSGIKERIVIPADYVIHDRINAIHHPLVGMSPIKAAAVEIAKGSAINNNSASFFGNAATPSGLLSVPAPIGQEEADQIKERWNSTYTGRGLGGVAVLGEGAKYEPIANTAQDSQLVEQLRYSNEQICTIFKMPRFKVGLGEIPPLDQIQGINVLYFADCIQARMMSIQHLLGSALLSNPKQEWRFETDSLIMMDKKTQVDIEKAGILGGLSTPNEGRRILNRPPVAGGETPYLQQQNFSLAALAKRDAKDDPFSSGGGKSHEPPTPDVSPEPSPDDDTKEVKLAMQLFKAMVKQ